MLFCSADNRTTQAAQCDLGNVRLADNSTDETAGTIRGRVELCINNAWGTVCGDLFSQEDAGTLCVQLQGYSRDGTRNLFALFDEIMFCRS